LPISFSAICARRAIRGSLLSLKVGFVGCAGVQLGCDEGEEFSQVGAGPSFDCRRKSFWNHWNNVMASKVSATLQPDIAHAAPIEPDNEPHRLKQAKEERPAVLRRSRFR